MYLFYEGKEIPTRWKHDPTMRDGIGMTIAEHAALRE